MLNAHQRTASPPRGATLIIDELDGARRPLIPKTAPVTPRRPPAAVPLTYPPHWTHMASPTQTRPVDTKFTPYIPKSSVKLPAPPTIPWQSPHSGPMGPPPPRSRPTKVPALPLALGTHMEKIDTDLDMQIETVHDDIDPVDNPNDILLEEHAVDKSKAPSSRPIPVEVSRAELDHHDARDRARMLRISCMHRGLADALDYWYGKRPVPFLPPVQLRDYQVRIMNWMALREKYPVHGICGGFVGPEMGLGKTLTVSAFCMWCKRPPEGPTLIVASLNVLAEWHKHFVNFYEPEVLAGRVVFLHKDFNASTASLCRADLARADIVLTNYETVQSSYRHLLLNFPDDADSCIQYRNEETRKQILAVNVRKADSVYASAKCLGTHLIHQGMHWGRLVCDESQTIANPGTKSFRAIMAVAAPRRWGVTGTMVRNYVHDIWAQLRYAGYNKVASKRMWTRASAPRYYRVHGLSAVIYALTYEQAGVVLPPFHIEDVHVQLDERARDVYSLIEAKARKTYQLALQKKMKPGDVRTMIMRLRQCCTGAVIMNGHGAIDALLKEGANEGDSFLSLEYNADELMDSEEDMEGESDGDDDDDGDDNDDDEDNNQRGTKRERSGDDEKNEKEEPDTRPAKKARFSAAPDGVAEGAVVAKTSHFKSDKEVLEYCTDISGPGGIYSPKMRAAIGIIERHMAHGPKHKIICFSMFTKSLELLVQAITAAPTLSAIGVILVDGKVTKLDRDAALTSFRNNPDNRILCIQGKVGGEGLNLQCATGGFQLEHHWTYQSKKQQRRRFWRVGQTEETWWYDLVVDGTIEQRVIEICEEKIKLEEDFQNRKRGRIAPQSQQSFYGQLLGFKK